MSTDRQVPAGLTLRRRRMSDEETAQRMLATATRLVHTSGLTVSLEHLRIEEIIREAGVSRTAVYRRWPYKDLFFNEVLTALARDPHPQTSGYDDATMADLRSTALAHLDWLETADGRRDLCAELLRRGAMRDFRLLHQSSRWRTYVALNAAFLSLPDGDLRHEVQAALASSENEILLRIAEAGRALAQLLGYRLRPELDLTFEALARLASATMTGLAIKTLATPQTATERFEVNPFGSTDLGSWSLPAIGLAGVVMIYLEPDPEVDWDGARIASVRTALETEA